MAKIIKVQEHQSGVYARYERDALHVPEKVAEPVEPEEEEAEPLPDPAEILAQARDEAERKVKEAYAEGFRRGEEKGLEEFRASVDVSANVFREAADSIHDARQTYLATLIPQVAELAKAVAKRILQRECQTDDELILRTVRAALEALVDRQHIVMRIHPDDLAVLRTHKSEIIAEFEGIDRFRIETTEEVFRGGCVVESDTMVIDATLEAQLRRVFDTLLE